MSQYISDILRALVAKRANYCCEYCGIHQEDLVFTFQIDHIISLKHFGLTTASNLAFACSLCNQNKGSNIATIMLDSGRMVRLFNPRKDKWRTHFDLLNGQILAKTRIGIATIHVLDLNNLDRVLLRKVLEEVGRYPR